MNDTDFDFPAIVASGRPVLIDFYATWCAPCMGMQPMLDALQRQLGDRVQIVKVDVDQHLDLAVEQRVMGVPTLALWLEGREYWRSAGVVSKGVIMQAIEQLETMDEA